MEDIRLKIMVADTDSSLELPLASSGVSAGFPSPADDYIESALDLNKALINNPYATFFARVDGESMKDEGINDGDLLIIDKLIEPVSGAITVCYIDGEFTLKRLLIEDGVIMLMPANKKYKPIIVSPEESFIVWGVVTYSIKKH